jgi:hypothetical protein
VPQRNFDASALKCGDRHGRFEAMAINRVEIQDFLVFKGKFVVDFCPGVNVLIGGNATGKTTLMKCSYLFTKRFL